MKKGRRTTFRTNSGPGVMVRSPNAPPVVITPHARQQMQARGIAEKNVVQRVLAFLARQGVHQPTALVAPDFAVVLERKNRRVVVVTVGAFQWFKRGTRRVAIQAA